MNAERRKEKRGMLALLKNGSAVNEQRRYHRRGRGHVYGE
jgi:hypothetical protein